MAVTRVAQANRSSAYIEHAQRLIKSDLTKFLLDSIVQTEARLQPIAASAIRTLGYGIGRALLSA